MIVKTYGGSEVMRRNSMARRYRSTCRDPERFGACASAAGPLAGLSRR